MQSLVYTDKCTNKYRMREREREGDEYITYINSYKLAYTGDKEA